MAYLKTLATRVWKWGYRGHDWSKPGAALKEYLYFNFVAIDKWLLNVLLGPIWNILFKPEIKFGHHMYTMSAIMGMNLLVGNNGRWGSFKIICGVLNAMDKGHCRDAAAFSLLYDDQGKVMGVSDQTEIVLPTKQRG